MVTLGVGRYRGTGMPKTYDFCRGLGKGAGY